MSCEPYYSIVRICNHKTVSFTRDPYVIVYHYVIVLMEPLISLMFFYTSSVLIPSISATVVVFLVFMLRHKILKSKFNRPAKLSMPLDVR